MTCNHSTSSFMIMITITLVLIPLLGNAQKIPNIRCPFNLSCNHHNKKILEIPSYPVPIKLLINHINYTSQVLEASDPQNCLPRLLLLQPNFTTSIFPFRIIYEFNNISFFDCSSLGQRYLNRIYKLQGVEQQDMISCPIYMAGFDDNIIELNLEFCTKLSERASPLILPEETPYGYHIPQNSISLSWSETNLDKGCLECKHKLKKKISVASADGFRRALVYDFFPNGSLQKSISPSNNKDDFLGWDKLQQIALGIANGIEYLHQGCDQRILHFDINPHNVLLDDNFTPKITDFGLAKMCSKNQSIVSMSAAKGTIGYMAPEVFSRNFGNVSYKSDIYSYGMLLLEMVGGRKNTKTTSGEENIQVEYPDWIHNLLEGGDFRIPKKLATVGLWCIQWHPLHRPTMKFVIQMLQGEGNKLTVPTNPFGPTTTTNTNANIVAERMNLELEVIEELE